jgi:hypothetical protein
LIALVRTWFLIALLSAGAAWAQLPIVTQVHLNDGRIAQFTGGYTETHSGYEWQFTITQVKGQYQAQMRTTGPDIGEQNALIRLKQVPPLPADGADSLRYEGTGTSVEGQKDVILVMILRSNATYAMEIHQGTFSGSLSHYPTWTPEGGHGADIGNPQPTGNKLYYVANGSGLFSTAFATVKGAKLGACTLKAKGPGFKLSMPGEIVQNGGLSFVPSTVKPSVLKIGKLRLTIAPENIAVTVADGS